MMKYPKISYLLLAMLTLFAIKVKAQRPFEVLVNIMPPYPTDLNRYEEEFTNFVFTVINHTDVDQEFYLTAELVSDAGVSISFNPGFRPNSPYMISPRGVMVLTGGQLLEDYGNLSTADLNIVGLSAVNALTGSLPEGNYSLCANAVDFQTSTVLSTGCSFEFTPNFPTIPEIIFPVNESVITSIEAGLLNITWLPPSPGPDGVGMFTYTLKIIDITDSPLVDYEALFYTGGLPVMVEEEVNGINYPYNGEGSDPPLEVGHSYAVRVRAVDPMNIEATANSGYSEIVTFTIGDANGDTGDTDDDYVVNLPEDCETRCNIPTIRDSVAVTSLAGIEGLRMGYFRIYDTQLNVVDSVFSGTGKIQLNFLNNLRLNVRLEGVKINSSGEIFAGSIKTKTNSDPQVTDLLNYVNLGVVEDGVALAQDYIPRDISAQLGNYLKESRLVTGLLGLNTVEMPIAFTEKIKGNEFTVGITQLQITPLGAKANIVAGLKLAMFDGPNWLMFTGKDVCLHPAGFGGDYTLGLGADLVVNDNSVNPNAFEVKLKGGEEGCQISVGCTGVRAARIVGELDFPRNLLIPEAPDGTIAEGKVSATFGFDLQNTQARDTIAVGSNWLAELRFTPFQIKGLKNWSFNVSTGYWDMSDLENAPAMRFPVNYAQSDSTFQGVYIKRATVRAPASMSAIPSERAFVDIEHILIDPSIYMNVTAVDLLNMEQGQLDSWAFALDTFRLNIYNNRFESGSLAGKLHMPMLDTGTHLSITAMITQQGANATPTSQAASGDFIYDFHVNFTDTVNLPVLIASADINPDSYINVQYDAANEGNSTITAVLHGMLTMDTDRLPSSFPQVPAKIKLPGVNFSIGYNSDDGIMDEHTHIAFASPQKNIGGFPINLDEFSFTSIGNMEMAANFGVSLQLAEGSEDLGGITVGFKIISEMPNTQQMLAVKRAGQAVSLVKSIKLKRIQFDSISINVHTAAVDLEGKIMFFNELNEQQQRNKGIRGDVRATVNLGVAVEGRLTVLFGTFGVVPENVETYVYNETFYKYWYVDGQIMVSQGIPIAPGIGIYGIAGGLGKNVLQTACPVASGEGFVGESVFVPTFGTSRLKFGVTFGTLPAKAFNADLAFEAIFIQGGLDQINITGAGYVMCYITDRANAKVTVQTELRLLMANDSRPFSFEGFILVAVNVDPILIGNMDGGTIPNQMVRADFHVSSETWYFYMGQPEMNYNDAVDPRGTALLDLTIVQADLKAYLMVGDGVPTSLPPLPPDVYRILNNPGGDYEGTSATTANQGLGGSDYSTGTGFAHGAYVAIRADIDAFLIYANLAVYLGYDMNMTVRNSRCAQTGQLIGINGFYAEGQAYVGLEGGMGLKIKLFGADKRFELFRLSAAIALAGGGPNPFYFTGRATVRYRILGGRIRGSSSFSMNIGERCAPMLDDPFGGITFIEEVSPTDGATNQFPGRSMHVKLALPVFEDIVIPNPVYDNNGDIVSSNNLRYQPRLSFRLRKRNVAADIPMKAIQWLDEEEKTQAYMSPNAALQPNTQYELYIKINAFDYQTNRILQLVNDAGNPTGEWKQDTTVRFTTGNLPEDLYYFVNYTIPLPNQRYFTQGDNSKGRINLSQMLPRDTYFPTSTGFGRDEYQYYVRFTNLNTDQSNEVPFQYLVDQQSSFINGSWVNRSSNYLSFDVPGLINENYYVMQVIRKKPASGITVASVNGQSYKKIYESRRANQNEVGGDGPSTILEIGQEASVPPEQVLGENEFLLYHMFFRTSRYNTLMSKVDAMTAIGSSWQGDHPEFGKKLRVSYSIPEKFEDRDISNFDVQAHPDVAPLTFRPRLVIMDIFNKTYHNNKAKPKVNAVRNNVVGSALTSIWNNFNLNFEWNNPRNVVPRNRIVTSSAPPIGANEYEHLWNNLASASRLVTGLGYNSSNRTLQVVGFNSGSNSFDVIYDTHFKVGQDKKTIIDGVRASRMLMGGRYIGLVDSWTPSINGLTNANMNLENNSGIYDLFFLRNLSSKPNEEVLDILFGARSKSFNAPAVLTNNAIRRF